MMLTGFAALLKKDFKLLISGKFILLALGSLILYSCYIHFFYVNLDQESYTVYLYDPYQTQGTDSSAIIRVEHMEQLEAEIRDGYTIGIDASGDTPEVLMVSSGISSNDHYRSAYALSLLSPPVSSGTTIIGAYNKEMKNRREITCEFLFFELSAVGFLGLASLIFKEKKMGVIRVLGILPASRAAFILSKLCLFLISDLIFAILLTFINLGISGGISVLPAVILQAGILSLIMALTGFFCAILLPDFRQFSLLYLVLAVFITTPVFLAGQTGISYDFIKYHPMYHMFMAMKQAYFDTPSGSFLYYTVCGLAMVLLFLSVYLVLNREMAKEAA